MKRRAPWIPRAADGRPWNDNVGWGDRHDHRPRLMAGARSPQSAYEASESDEEEPTGERCEDLKCDPPQDEWFGQGG